MCNEQLFLILLLYFFALVQYMNSYLSLSKVMFSLLTYCFYCLHSLTCPFHLHSWPQMMTNLLRRHQYLFSHGFVTWSLFFYLINHECLHYISQDMRLEQETWVWRFWHQTCSNLNAILLMWLKLTSLSLTKKWFITKY